MRFIKNTIKRVLGDRAWKQIVSTIKYIKCVLYYASHKIEKKQIRDDWEESVYAIDGRNVFFGYYDIKQMNEQEDKLLAHVVSKKARTSIDVAEIGYFSVHDRKFHLVASTNAWCWQQGARLRWHPLNPNQIVFNAKSGNSYVAQIWDVDKGVCVHEICKPLYDFDKSFSIGLSLNFQRLQRLRPGYGYDSLPDLTCNDTAPENDGIYFVNLNKNTSKLVVKLRELAILTDPDLKCDHYVNHISLAPDGKHFIFFHVWNRPNNKGWRTRLYVADTEEFQIKLLEEKDKVSHYVWYNEQKIIVTCYRKNMGQYYAIYNVDTGEKRVLGEEFLCLDGHPSMLNDNLLVSDTYPRNYCQQELFVYDMEQNIKSVIAKLYSSPLMYDECRCDLHPRISESKEYITVDTTFMKNRRAIMLLKRRRFSE